MKSNELTLCEMEDLVARLEKDAEKVQTELECAKKKLQVKRGVLWFDPWLAPEGYVATMAKTARSAPCVDCAFKDTECYKYGLSCNPMNRPDCKRVFFVPIEHAIEQWMTQKRIEHGVFLDGEKARAVKKSDGHWIVKRHDGKGLDMECASESVRYILLHNKGRF